MGNILTKSSPNLKLIVFRTYIYSNFERKRVKFRNGSKLQLNLFYVVQNQPNFVCVNILTELM